MLLLIVSISNILVLKLAHWLNTEKLTEQPHMCQYALPLCKFQNAQGFRLCVHRIKCSNLIPCQKSVLIKRNCAFENVPFSKHLSVVIMEGTPEQQSVLVLKQMNMWRNI